MTEYWKNVLGFWKVLDFFRKLESVNASLYVKTVDDLFKCTSCIIKDKYSYILTGIPYVFPVLRVSSDVCFFSDL